MNIDLTKYEIINYWHDKETCIVLKVLNKTTNEIEQISFKNKGEFFIDEKDLEKTKEVLTNFFVTSQENNDVHINIEYEKENNYYKVIYNIPITLWIVHIINKFRDVLDANNIKHYELDLTPGDNYILNNEITITDKLRILYFDIETDDRQGGIEIGRDRILSICSIDNKGNEFIICDDDERTILKKFCELIDDYDVITGWNSQRFDYPYIKERCKLHKVWFSTKDPMHVDLMKVFMGSFAFSHSAGKRHIDSFALDNIAKMFLADSKLVIESSGVGFGGRLWNLFTTKRDELIKYNMQDSKLLFKLDSKFNLIKNEIEISRLVQAPLSQTRSINSTMDFVLLREARKRGIHFKTKPFIKFDKDSTNSAKRDESTKYPGGAVLDPIPGLYTNVNIYDFASLYPNIVRTFNISPETILEKEELDCIKLPNGVFFTQQEGIAPYILNKLVNLRYKYRDEQILLKTQGKDDEAYVKEFQQTAVKVVILEMYGIMGSIYSRFFNRDVARSITETGQHLLKSIANNLGEEKVPVIYGDTDSIFFKLDEETNRVKVENVIKDTINSVVKSTNTHREHTLTMKHEKVLGKYIILAKKKYVGRCVWEEGKICDELYYRGIELHKGSELLLTKKLLTQVLNSIFYDNASEKDIEKIVASYKKKLYNKEIDNVDDIVIIKKVGKLSQEYKNTPAHVTLAVDRQAKGELMYVGQRVPHIVLSNSPLKIIHKDDFVGEFDNKYYWENQVYPPTLRLLQVVYPLFFWDKHSKCSLHVQQTLF